MADSVLKLGLQVDNRSANAQLDQTNAKLAQLDKTASGVGARGNGLSRVERDAVRAAAAARGANGAFQEMQAILSTLGQALVVALTAPLLLAARYAFEVARQLDSVEKGLSAILGSRGLARAQIAELREVARAPGLDFQVTVSSYRRLVAAGLDSRLSTAAVKEFGNALALVGASSQDLDGVGVALQQIVSKGKVSAEEINQIAERMPQIRQLMRSAFGTADTEELQRRNLQPVEFIRQLTLEAQKLPRATTDIGNEVKNFRDSVKLALIPVGQDIAQVVIPALQGLAREIAVLGAAYRDLDPPARRALLLFLALVAAAGPALASLNLLRGAVLAVVSGWKLLTGLWTASTAAQTAETAATHAQAAAVDRLAAAQGRLAAATVASGGAEAAQVFAGNAVQAGLTAGNARTLDAAAEIAANRQRTIDILRARKASQESAGVFSYLKVGGAAAGTAESRATGALIEKQTARLAEANAALAVQRVRLGEVRIAASAAATETGAVASQLAAAEAGAAGAARGFSLLGGSAVALAAALLLVNAAFAFRELTQFNREFGSITAQWQAAKDEVHSYAVAARSAVKDIASLIGAEKLESAAMSVRELWREVKRLGAELGDAIFTSTPLGQVALSINNFREQFLGDRLAMNQGGAANLAKLNAANAEMARAAAEAAGGYEERGRADQQKLQEQQQVIDRRRALTRDLTLELQKQRTEAELAKKEIGDAGRIMADRAAERVALIEREGAAFGEQQRALFDAITNYRVLEVVYRDVAKTQGDLRREVEEYEKSVTAASRAQFEAMAAEYGDKLKAEAEKIRQAIRNLRAGIDAALEVDLQNAGARREADLAAIEMVETQDVASKVRSSQAKLEVERRYIAESLRLDLERINNRFAAEEQTEELRQRLANEEFAARAKAQVALEKAGRDAAVEQYRIVRDEGVRAFNAVKDHAGEVFDALTTRTRSFGDVVRNILLTALLTPVREFTTNWVAALLSGQQAAARSTAPAGGGGGVAGTIRGWLGGGGFAPTSPFTPGFAGGGGAAAVSPVPGVIGLGQTAAGQVVPMTGGSSTSLFGGLLGNGKNFLTQLGQLGATNRAFANGVYGAKGGAMLAGGGILAYDGLRRGGLVGLAETTAGGALIGAKFGGPVGAAIGAAVGLGAGIVRLFVKGFDQQVREQIKRAYGVDIADKGVLKQLSEIIKSTYGGNIATGIQSKQIRELVQLYAASTGQRYSGPATEAGTLNVVQNNGTLTALPGTGSFGQALTANPSFQSLASLNSSRPASSATYGEPAVIYLSIDGASAAQFLQGQAVQAVNENPRVAANAVAAASQRNINRRESGVSALSPGLLLA